MPESEFKSLYVLQAHLVLRRWVVCALAVCFLGVRALAQDPSLGLTTITGEKELAEAKTHLGSWIWDLKTFDKQTCRLWKSFDVPRGATVSSAALYITVDNGYRLFLDGREIGQGSDWKTLSKYDVKWLLGPGRHVLAVQGFNERLEGGLVFGLQTVLAGGRVIDVRSDNTWRVVPLKVKNWENVKRAAPAWPSAKVVGALGTPPWNTWPFAVVSEAPLQPIIVHFWETVWFQIIVLMMFGVVLLICLWLVTQLALQSKSQRLLHLQRARIARDIHDDLGARLTQLLLLGEIAQTELPAQSDTRAQIDRICEQARDVAQAVDEVVWAVSSRRDTLRDFAAYVCQYAQLFLKDTSTRCRLDVEPELPPTPFDLAIRRNLLLAVKEAISNAAKHSGAGELILRIHRLGDKVQVVVEDDGAGFDVSQANASRNGLMNMAQRMQEVGGRFDVYSGPGFGCRIEFNLPLTHARRHPHWMERLLGTNTRASELEILNSPPMP
jgi:signal transduction histidine kinase